MKFYLMTFIMIMLTTTITGCGGGEEDSPSQKVADIVQPTEVVTEEPITTSDLISKPDFDFISSININVILPASPSTNIGYFINICTDFSNENDKITINYDSCKLRTTLTTVTQQFSLSLSTAELLLIAQIWPIENGAQPINVSWDIAESGGNWNIAI